MADVFDKKTRSRCMSHIHSRDTKPELIVRHYLYSRGYRYRKNCRLLPGTPDIVMKKYGVAIFIHGCFWHGHDVDGTIPKTNVQFWENKINRNKQRDAEVTQKLKDMGWNVMTIWECQLKPAVREKTLLEVEYWINKSYIEHLKPSKSYDEMAENAEGELKVAEEDATEY
jgi:DNA mismatch endonuclease (patch repair protein)